MVWNETVILVDADYADGVVFDLIVNFERMLDRRIPQADLARWIECLALDAGLRPEEGPQTVNVVLLHSNELMQNFQPSAFADLDGQAFSSPLGEFLISCVVVDKLTTMEQLFNESRQALRSASEVKRIIAVPGIDDRDLGFSLTAALGISSDEINKKIK